MTSGTEQVPLPDGEMAEIKVRKSRRARRIILRTIPQEPFIELVLPWGVGREEGLKFALLKARWIKSTLSAEVPPVVFANGVEIPYLGNNLLIRHWPYGRGAARLFGSELFVSGRSKYLPRRVGDWLRARAKEEITRRATEMAARLGERFGRITLRDPATRWGSCSEDGNLSFSWRLIFAPEAVLDYVIAHEVAHLRELNHSPDFWALVESLVGDSLASRKWMREHGPDLHRFG